MHLKHKISNFYELETGGNFKLEPMSLQDNSAISCVELIKSRLTNKFMAKNSIKNIEIQKIWKIYNKNFKMIFESIADSIELSGGGYGMTKQNSNSEEKKIYDYLFLFIDISNIKDILKQLSTNFENYKVTF